MPQGRKTMASIRSKIFGSSGIIQNFSNGVSNTVNRLFGRPNPQQLQDEEVDLDNILQGHLEVFYQTCTVAAINEAKTVCKEEYHDNSTQFLSSFISPVCNMFQALKKDEEWCNCGNHDLWPVCFNENIVIHLRKLSEHSLNVGDFYVYVSVLNSNEPCLNVCYSTPSGIKEQVISDRDIDRFFAMEILNRTSSCSDEELGHMLQRCLVLFEGSVQHLKWDETTQGCQDCKRNRMIEDLLKNQAGMWNGSRPNYLCLTEGLSGMNSNGGGATSGPGPGGGQRPNSPRSPGFYKHRNLDAPKTIMDVDYKLLNSGIAVLPGSRDTEERPVVFIFTNSSLWQNQQVPSTELARLLMYYRTVPREEIRMRGVTIVAVIQGATTSIINTLLESLYLFEGNCPGGIAVLHFLADAYTQPLLQMSPVFDSQTPFKLDVLLAPELLQEFIPLDQLPLDLDGLYMYNHEEWIRFHVELDPFMSKIRNVAKYLMVTMQDLSEPQVMPVSTQEARHLIEHHEQTMRTAFNDPRLISLQNEGESVINCLRRMDAHMGHSEDYRDLMESVNRLYDNLNSTMVKLVHIADNRLSKLEHCQQLREFEEECTKIITWTERTGEESLQRHAHLGDNLKAIRGQQKEFDKFYFSAMTHIEKGNDLLDEASMLAQSGNFDEATGYKELARTLKKHLQSFTSRLEDTREQIERTSKCYQLLDRTYEWALDAMKYVASMKMEHCETLSGLDKLLRSLDLYLRDHPVMKPETFTYMFDLAEKLQSEKMLEQCRVAKERCDETQKLLTLRQCTLKRAREKLVMEERENTPSESRKSSVRELSPAGSAVNSGKFPVPQESVWEPQSSSTPLRQVKPHPELRKSVSDRFLRSQLPREDFYTQDMSDRIVTALPKSLIDSRLGSSREDLSESASDMANASPSHTYKSSPIHSMSPILANSTSTLPLHNRPQKKIIKRAPTVPLPGNVIMEEEDLIMDRNRPLWSKSQDPRPISMITASSDSLSSLPEEEENQAPEGDNPPPVPPLPQHWAPVPVNTHLTSMPAVSELKLSSTEKSKRTLCHIMREMVQTERDYVLSLQYVIENYIPELQRPDVPQALRGKGSIIFGNIEKIYQFHRQYFLREVERCERNPFQISHYFLMHEAQFYLYALYNKNKPKSDMLMAEYGKHFFKDKQAKLGDRMDLGSYLLKPVQRMGKYALLLKQIMKECPPSDQEFQDLRAAEQMVKFQLRHGNDLLAMDSLRECDVNLQEQGRLLRQDEFIVWQGRKKSLRHVFLFEDLILFSKTRRGRNGGPDSYLYKFSLKMAEVGLTENYGDTGYKFEIWFRKRSRGSYILQAQSSDVRHHWVKEISRVLWNQAIKNREKHMSEMATMGIGNKPCLEIKPSANQINDRFINVASGNFQSRTRNSIAVSSFDHMYQNNKRPHSIISVSSTSSSSSSHSGAFYPQHLTQDSSRTNYLSNESGIGTDISSGEDHGAKYYDQSERGIMLTKEPMINKSELFSDTISTDV
ncbi:pleckstrin homology domain-containing family G member 4B-like isoform X2 [Saccostrea cucullata]|uniref:pleckstrin homology domain-containing family G member 4B-like isoform X2 n=3 Tax=Saccostrea cuccullata TaxID=36930 RepID=UPI002ED54F1C